MRIEIVQTGSNRRKAFHIILIAQRIKDHHSIQLLEQGKISISAVRSSKNILARNIILIGINQMSQTVTDHSHGKSGTTQLIHLILQLSLQQHQFLNLNIILGAFYTITCREVVISGMQLQYFSRIN